MHPLEPITIPTFSGSISSSMDVGAPPLLSLSRIVVSVNIDTKERKSFVRVSLYKYLRTVESNWIIVQ